MAIEEIERALDHFKKGEPEAAIPILEEVIELVPTYVIAHVLLAQAYEASMQEEKSVRAWRQAYRMIPNSPVQPASGQQREEYDAFLAQLADASAGRTSLIGSAPGLGVDADPDAVVLRVSDLIKRYRNRAVVKAVELEVAQGEVVGLLGPNGAGKTTTFYMIVGMVRADGGNVFLGDEDITNMPMFERARRGIGYLAQEASIFSQLSVEDNLHAVLEYQHLSKADRMRRVEELIVEFGLERVRKSKGYMLSGGERRRTEIARALATRPRFFLLDEPFSGVDPIAVEDIQNIVAGLRNRGIGVLITDHNVHETLAITDRAYLLYEGKILKQGTAEALAADPEVRERYLGEKFTLERYR
jgi:lipopolysaccharide export system ATP-binding protein